MIRDDLDAVLKTVCENGCENFTLPVRAEVTEDADGKFRVEALCTSDADFCGKCKDEAPVVEKEWFLSLKKLES